MLLFTHMESLSPPPSILLHHQTFGVCERSSRPVLESANRQHHFMFVVPLWWFLSGGFGLSKLLPPPSLSLHPPLDFTFTKGLCKMLSLVSNMPWMSCNVITWCDLTSTRRCPLHVKMHRFRMSRFSTFLSFISWFELFWPENLPRTSANPSFKWNQESLLQIGVEVLTTSSKAKWVPFQTLLTSKSFRCPLTGMCGLLAKL